MPTEKQDISQFVLQAMPRLTYEDFITDRMCVDAAIENFLIIGKAANKLPDEIRNEDCSVDWKKYRGLRDVLIHAYFRIDDENIWDIIEKKRQIFKDEAEQIPRGT